MNVVVTSTSADPEPVLEVEKSTDKQPYFRLNSELSSKKNGKKIAEKKGGYIEGHLELGSLGKDEVQSVELFMGCEKYPFLHPNLLNISLKRPQNRDLPMTSDAWKVEVKNAEGQFRLDREHHEYLTNDDDGDYWDGLVLRLGKKQSQPGLQLTVIKPTSKVDHKWAQMSEVLDRRLQWLVKERLPLENGQGPLQEVSEEVKKEVLSHFKKGNKETDEAHKGCLVARIFLTNGQVKTVKSNTFYNSHRHFQDSDEKHPKFNEKIVLTCCQGTIKTQGLCDSLLPKIKAFVEQHTCDGGGAAGKGGGRKRKTSTPDRSPDSGMSDWSSPLPPASPDKLQQAIQTAGIFSNDQGGAKSMRVETVQQPFVKDISTGKAEFQSPLWDVNTSLTSGSGDINETANELPDLKDVVNEYDFKFLNPPPQQYNLTPTVQLVSNVDEVCQVDDIPSDLSELLESLDPDSLPIGQMHNPGSSTSNTWNPDGPAVTKFRKHIQPSNPLDADVESNIVTDDSQETETDRKIYLPGIGWITPESARVDKPSSNDILDIPVDYMPLSMPHGEFEANGLTLSQSGSPGRRANRKSGSRDEMATGDSPSNATDTRPKTFLSPFAEGLMGQNRSRRHSAHLGSFIWAWTFGALINNFDSERFQTTVVLLGILWMLYWIIF